MSACGRDEVAMMADDDSELARLRVENARLIGLLDIHGITWRTSEPTPVPDRVAIRERRSGLWHGSGRGGYSHSKSGRQMSIVLLNYTATKPA
jgi:hypothetical protein